MKLRAQVVGRARPLQPGARHAGIAKRPKSIDDAHAAAIRLDHLTMRIDRGCGDSGCGDSGNALARACPSGDPDGYLKRPLSRLLTERPARLDGRLRLSSA